MARREPGTESRLSRARIVGEAVKLVDREGLAALSMRRLGSELGVEAMALYRYVEGREHLLELVVEEVTGEVERVADMELGPDGGWQAYLQQLAHSVRDLAYAHPNVFPLVTTRNPAAPWIRPPLRNLDVVEDFLVTLTEHGFSDDQAVDAYRSFTSFLVGHLLLGVAQRSATSVAAGAGAETVEDSASPAGGHHVAGPGTDHDPLAEYPTIRRLSVRLAVDFADDEFEVALEAMLNRLDELVSA